MRQTILETLSPTEILALTIIGEARGEPIQGQVAVGCVIRNRMMASPNKYKSLSDVCLEPKQFSCWNETDPNYTFLIGLVEKLVSNNRLNDLYLRQCFWVAQGIASWDIIDNTKSSIYYLTNELFNSPKRPNWSLNAKNVHIINGQTFFSLV